MNALAALKHLKSMLAFNEEKVSLVERQGGTRPNWKLANISALKIAIDLMEGRLDEASFKMGFDAGVKHQRERSPTLKATTAELAKQQRAMERYRRRLTKIWNGAASKRLELQQLVDNQRVTLRALVKT